MALGTTLVLAALSLFLWNRWEDKRAGAAAQDVLAEMLEHLEENEEALPQKDGDAMTEIEIGGYACIGCLSIPALELELPVLGEWDYARLKVAPCRYTGSVGSGDLVIAAHNYARHFGSLSRLSAGETVYFTDMDKETWTYEVAAVETLAPAEIEAMTDSGYDLTLFTCTYGGKSRVTVRCTLTDAGYR